MTTATAAIHVASASASTVTRAIAVTPSVPDMLYALMWAAIGGVLAWLVTYPLHRRSLGGLLAAVVLTATSATVAGVLGSVHEMSLPKHEEWSTITVAVVAGLVTSVIAARAAHRLARDNRIVRDAVAELGAGRVPSSGGRRLTPQLEQMRKELAETAQRLASSRERERALESSRRELVAWVSHDLRTPLASLRAMAEALEDGVAEVPELYYKQMRTAVDRLARMVDDLFELSRIQSGSFAIDTERVALDDIVSDSIATLEPLATAQHLTLTGHSDGAAIVSGNAPELSRAVINLVANAIRHTGADGVVDVRVRNCPGSAEVSVLDECGGIPDDELDRIFDVGFRGERARSPSTPNPGGAGLGLTIARGIVEAHGGTVDVINVGAGCRFTIRLPKPV
jgi:signal transduction histidine kinase